jgi:hypothetical protein
MIGALSLATAPSANAAGIVFVVSWTALLAVGLAAYVRTGWLQ